MTAKRINPYNLFVGSFTPNWLMARKEVSAGAKLTYARLAQYAGKDGDCRPKLETVAEEIGIHPRSISRHITELRRHGLIETEDRPFNQPNRYFFLDHPWMDACKIRQIRRGRHDKSVVAGMSDSAWQGRQICRAHK